MAKYGKKAGEKVEKAMHEMKRGELKSGGSGKTVKSRKQAIAIGLSEAAKPVSGQVPQKKSVAKKSASKKSAAKKSASKKSVSKKSASKKSPAKKAASKKKAAKK